MLVKYKLCHTSSIFTRGKIAECCRTDKSSKSSILLRHLLSELTVHALPSPRTRVSSFYGKNSKFKTEFQNSSTSIMVGAKNKMAKKIKKLKSTQAHTNESTAARILVMVWSRPESYYVSLSSK